MEAVCYQRGPSQPDGKEYLTEIATELCGIGPQGCWSLLPSSCYFSRALGSQRSLRDSYGFFLACLPQLSSRSAGIKGFTLWSWGIWSGESPGCCGLNLGQNQEEVGQALFTHSDSPTCRRACTLVYSAGWLLSRSNKLNLLYHHCYIPETSTSKAD